MQPTRNIPWFTTTRMTKSSSRRIKSPSNTLHTLADYQNVVEADTHADEADGIGFDVSDDDVERTDTAAPGPPPITQGKGQGGGSHYQGRGRGRNGDLYHVSPVDLFARVLSSSQTKTMHFGMAMLVVTATETWYSAQWAGSIRTTSGEFAFCPNGDNAGEPAVDIFPRDFIEFQAS
ncbi:hypothetical protein FJTKL_02527 [Diaporthe vaccinii]|uniref:Uncharacterized protein n=1 Tax=Diaporthe vaccinii TaxID=105482 RepID=A0ABR4DY25_9PEZI